MERSISLLFLCLLQLWVYRKSSGPKTNRNVQSWNLQTASDLSVYVKAVGLSANLDLSPRSAATQDHSYTALKFHSEGITYDFYQEFQRRNHSAILSNSRQGYAKLNIFHPATPLTQQTCTNLEPVGGTQLWSEWNGSRVRMPFLRRKLFISCHSSQSCWITSASALYSWAEVLISVPKARG